MSIRNDVLFRIGEQAGISNHTLIADTDNLEDDLDLDSLDIVQILQNLDIDANIIDYVDLSTLNTVGDLVKLVEENE